MDLLRPIYFFIFKGGKILKNDFLGRSLTVMNDFTIEEEMFLYHQTRKLKKNGETKKIARILR